MGTSEAEEMYRTEIIKIVKECDDVEYLVAIYSFVIAYRYLKK